MRAMLSRFAAPVAGALLLAGVAASPAAATPNSAPDCSWPGGAVHAFAGTDSYVYLSNLACTDADDDHLAVDIVSGPAHGAIAPPAYDYSSVDTSDHSVSVQSSTTLRIPAGTPAGADSFVMRLFDGKDYSAPVTVPVTISDSVTGGIDCDSPISDLKVYNNQARLLSARCYGPVPMSSAVTAAPADGQLQDFGTANSGLYLPAAGATGARSFTATVTDIYGNTATFTQPFTLVAPSAPTCVQTDAFDASVVQGDVRYLWSEGCDSNGGLDEKTEIVSHDGVGTWGSDKDDPTFTAPSDFTGDVHFAYRLVTDQGASNPINGVLHVVTGAVASSTPDCYGGDVASRNVRVGRSSVVDLPCDGTNLTATIETQPAHGTLTPVAESYGAAFTYTPDGTAGLDSFVFHVSGGGVTTPSQRMFIRALPADQNAVAANSRPWCDSYWSAIRPGKDDVAYAYCGDGDGDPTTVTATSAPAHGTLGAYSGDDEGFPFTPAAGFTGLDTFAIDGTDGALSATTSTARLWIRPGAAQAPITTTPPVTQPTTTPTPITIAPAPKGTKLLGFGPLSILDTSSGKGVPGITAPGIDPKTGALSLGTVYNGGAVPAQFGAVASTGTTGSIRVAFASAAKKKKAKTVKLGSVSVRVKPGATAALRFKIPAKVRKALGKAKTVKATVVYTVHPDGQKATSTKKTQTLKVGKVKKATKKKK